MKIIYPDDDGGVNVITPAPKWLAAGGSMEKLATKIVPKGKKYKIVEGSEFISLYSTSRKKEFASKVISNFFVESTELSIIEKINLAQKTKIKRPVFAVLKQRIIRLFNN